MNKFKECNQCPHEFNDKNLEPCKDCVPKKPTNADKIRSMNDEELEEFLCNISMCKPDYCPAYDTCMKTEHGTMNKWLQSEAE